MADWRDMALPIACFAAWVGLVQVHAVGGGGRLQPDYITVAGQGPA
jgi:hypothetical protein